ncbi:MAG: hypothetical protein ACRD4R_14200 [Candidatus Acidiferrales bacterium]
MNFKAIEDVANAVLYEGYLLYPYRLSAVKNRQRWNFGVLYPRTYSELQNGSDPWFMQAQCLLEASESAALDVKVRFLQAVSREVGRLRMPVPEWPRDAEPTIERVDSLEAGDAVLRPWQEAIECDLEFAGLHVADLLVAPVSRALEIPSGRELEPVKNKDGCITGVIIRTREVVDANVTIGAERREGGVIRLTIVVSNFTACANPQALPRDELLLKSLLSAHALMGIDKGKFFSLTDPPAPFRELTSACKNIGTWPVLAGEEGTANAMLCSPIILSDHPQIAPESAGNLFDGTEIDEILTLRILTLSEDEKSAIRESDDRARELLTRTESLPMEQLLKLHGALRDVASKGSAAGEPTESAEGWEKP